MGNYNAVYTVYCGLGTHCVSFCNASFGSVEIVIIFIKITTKMAVVVVMSQRRSRTGCLRTVTFESVNKPHPLLLYSSISLHCHTVNSLFRLSHSMLNVLYRNMAECRLVGEEEQ